MTWQTLAAAHAAEIEQLRSQLSSVESMLAVRTGQLQQSRATVEDMRLRLSAREQAHNERLSAKEQSILNLIAKCDDYRGEIARLKLAPEDHAKLVDRNEGRKRQRHPSTSYPQHVLDIDTLLQDCARYRNALAERDAEMVARDDKIHRQKVELHTLNVTLRNARNELAAYDACLTQVREEKPGLAERLKELSTEAEMNRSAFFALFEVATVSRALMYIEDLEQAEAANRNAIAIHMAHREGLETAVVQLEEVCRLQKLDIDRLTAANGEYNKRHVEQVARIERLEGANTKLRDLFFRTDTVARNARDNRAYSPYCMRCIGLTRMKKIAAFHWRCECGAEHDLSALAAADGQTTYGGHIDDVGVDKFADAMKSKLSKKRSQGRSGWDDPAVCSVQDLRKMMKDHVYKGDPVDIANFCMMIWNRLEWRADAYGQAYVTSDGQSEAKGE